MSSAYGWRQLAETHRPAVEPSQHREVVSFSIHAEVASLEPEQEDALLAEYSRRTFAGKVAA
jgi:hypothetical protein